MSFRRNVTFAFVAVIALAMGVLAAQATPIKVETSNHPHVAISQPSPLVKTLPGNPAVYQIKVGVPSVFHYRITDDGGHFLYSVNIYKGNTGITLMHGTGDLVKFHQTIVQTSWTWLHPLAGTYHVCVAAVDADMGFGDWVCKRLLVK